MERYRIYGCGALALFFCLTLLGSCSYDESEAEINETHYALSDDRGGEMPSASVAYRGWMVGFKTLESELAALIYFDDNGVIVEEEVPALQGPAGLLTVHALDSEHAWAGGWEGPFAEPQAILLARDECGWQVALSSSLCVGISAFDFLDDENGWAVCRYPGQAIGFRYQSGIWTPVNNPGRDASLDMVYYDVGLRSANHAFFAGISYAASGLAVLREVRQGFWSRPWTGGYFDSLASVDFDDAGRGYAARCTWRAGYSPVEMITYDEGDWRHVWFPRFEGCLQDLTVAPDGTWYASGTGNAIFRKTGNEWERMASPSPPLASELYGIDFPAAGLGFAVGHEGSPVAPSGLAIALRTEGQTWQRITLPNGAEYGRSLRDVSYVGSED
ncbi:MAG: hypothetical protein P9L99_17545 [Candidatus Lernaella stagnicola]|nr:hypothetical protein [Candidatus Lernaella stagnicola]